MTGSTHVIIGLAAAAFAHESSGVPVGVSETLLIVFGSIAPDIDGKGIVSRPGSLLRWLVGGSTAKVLNKIGGQISATIQSQFGHRGLLHTPLLCAGLLLLGGLLKSTHLLCFGWGYASHITADYFTAGGIPCFGPFSRKRFRAANIKTGSSDEIAVVFGILAGLILWATHSLRPTY